VAHGLAGVVEEARGRRASGSREPVYAARLMSPPRAVDQLRRWIAAEPCGRLHGEGRGAEGGDQLAR